MAVVGIFTTLLGLALGLGDIFGAVSINPIGEIFIGIGVLLGLVLTAIGFG